MIYIFFLELLIYIIVEGLVIPKHVLHNFDCYAVYETQISNWRMKNKYLSSFGGRRDVSIWYIASWFHHLPLIHKKVTIFMQLIMQISGIMQNRNIFVSAFLEEYSKDFHINPILMSTPYIQYLCFNLKIDYFTLNKSM